MTFANKLTAVAVQNVKSDGKKIRRLFDGEGLYLEISKENNRKGWRFKYRFEGRERRMSLGVYPDVSLEKARERKRQARELLADGIDPCERRKVDKLQKTKGNQNTFESVAEAWFDTKKKEWSESHQKRVSRILKRNLHPWIGKAPINQITPPILLKALQKTESEGKYETAMQAKQVAGQVLRYAVVTGKAERNFVPDLRGALTTPQTKHRAAITDPEGVGKLMLAIGSYKGSPEVCCALQLLPLVFVRSGELRHAEWDDIDLEKKTWTIITKKLKTRKNKSSVDLIVPLSRQALEILHYIKRFTGDYRYVFPNPRSVNRPMSENAVLVAIRSMGYAKDQMTGHGFRAMAKTLLEEELEFNTKWIEMQLAHTVKDAHGRAYNRAKYLKQRTRMMQAWADYLDDLKEKTKA
ncbi:MAG: integrase arm-type DNA-binding domain-containing protein [Hyphomicrobiales bacterium]|nr:integrase arm-type DNA-binding domain-containing protein [Hyphomicrobiales bacterium]